MSPWIFCFTEKEGEAMNKKVMLVITHSTDDHDRSNAAVALAGEIMERETITF